MSQAGTAPERLDLLTASAHHSVRDGGGYSTARLSESFGILLRHLSLETDRISIANAAGERSAETSIVRFICKFESGQPGAMIDLPCPLFDRLFVQIYGGDRGVVNTSAPTVSQHRFAERLGTRLCEWLESALPATEGRKLSQSEVRFPTHPAIADHIVIEAPVALEMDVAFSGNASFKLSFTIAAELMATKAHHSIARQPSLRPTNWSQQMLSRSGQVPLPVRSELAVASMPASRLMALQPGDVLSIAMPDLIPVLVSGQHFASAKIGDWHGCAALLIETLNESNYV